MKTIQNWLDEYGVNHKNSTNKTIHWICVPLIFFSILGLLYSVKLSWVISGLEMNLAMILAVLVIVYYAMLSRTLWLGMLLFIFICMEICKQLEENMNFPFWAICLVVFSLAWIGQFIGHKIEGAKPSFLKDVQFLLIGPAWLMSFIYKRLGIGV